MIRVTVRLLRDDGSTFRESAYDAPDDVELGDRGIVQHGSSYPATFFGEVVSLTSDYAGPAKTFRPLPRAWR